MQRIKWKGKCGSMCDRNVRGIKLEETLEKILIKKENKGNNTREKKDGEKKNRERLREKIFYR